MIIQTKPSEFTKELEALLNKHSLENGSDTPDFILAEYLTRCLQTWNCIVRQREKWYGRETKTALRRLATNRGRHDVSKP